MGPERIPAISDDDLYSLAEHIQPIINGQFVRPPADLRRVSYTWDSQPLGAVSGMAPIADITTYHTYGYYGFFKPSVAEILAQIPIELRSRVAAFEIVESPQTAEDLARHSEELNEGYHVATTRLYGPAPVAERA